MALSGIEVHVESYEIYQKQIKNCPFLLLKNSRYRPFKRLDYRWLDLRKPKNLLILRLDIYWKRQ